MTIQPVTRRSRVSGSLLLQYGICIVVALIVFVPIAATIFGGLKTTGELMSDPFGPPIPPPR